MTLRTYSPLVACLLLAAICLVPFSGASAMEVSKRQVEVVFVLDTTGSMAALIDGAKKKIWSIANVIIDKNPDASVRFGLVGYRDLGDEYVTRHFSLTEDVQAIYGQLLAFKADGGGDTPESVNEALDVAINKMHWSDSTRITADRILFLVGDAPPHMDYPQDRKYPEIIAEAVQRGIIVNTVQAGGASSTKKVWREMAKLGGGEYHAIPQDGGRVIVIATPYDTEINRIQMELNKTVIPYGSVRQQNEVRSKAGMYAEAPAASSVEMSRYVSKAGGGKSVITGDGDLTAVFMDEDSSLDLASLAKDELPEPMQAMTPEERTAYVAEQAKKREALARELAEQNAKRDAYIAQEAAAAPAQPADSFDASVSATLEKQMK
ncbi:VWA domain-containing protein [Desulfovibrio sp. OttesenSCG-928-I05]|nr:VWA domain-containing protein [Desulfovibrio sp. OttesenSCG-928-I05]